jgi:hypothetical protein
MNETAPALQQHPFPTIRVGGLWLIWIGLTITVATALAGNQGLHGPVFFLGFIAGVVGILLNRRLRERVGYGQPAKEQRVAMWFAIGLQAVLFTILGQLHTLDTRTFWLVALLIVGVHFLPMARLHGPTAAILGGLCMLNAVVGLLVPSIPFLGLGIVDGLLKIVFGVWMFTAASRE